MKNGSRVSPQRNDVNQLSRGLGGLSNMKILTTVSCRSGANIFVELFHFRGLLVVWDSTISGSLDRYLQRAKVTGA